MKPMLMFAFLGLAIMAGLLLAVVRWGDCALADLELV